MIALSALAMLAVAAGAGGALKTKKTTIQFSAMSDADFATAECKRGFTAISGGFDGPAFRAEGDGPYQIPIESRRQSKRAWTSTAYNDGTAGEFVVFVNCSDELRKLKTRSSSETIAGGDAVGRATARCPRRAEAVSGGFDAGVDDTDGDALVFVFESRRRGKRAWSVSGQNNANEPLDLTAFAYCAKRKLGLKTRSSEVTTDVDSSEPSATARCKRGQMAISGGFEANPEVFAQPFESRRSGKRGWVASMGAYPSDEFDATLTTFAYCLKKEKKG
jgi:hypothetical protein